MTMGPLALTSRTWVSLLRLTTIGNVLPVVRSVPHRRRCPVCAFSQTTVFSLRNAACRPHCTGWVMGKLRPVTRSLPYCVYLPLLIAHHRTIRPRIVGGKGGCAFLRGTMRHVWPVDRSLAYTCALW